MLVILSVSCAPSLWTSFNLGNWFMELPAWTLTAAEASPLVITRVNPNRNTQTHTKTGQLWSDTSTHTQQIKNKNKKRLRNACLHGYLSPYCWSLHTVWHKPSVSPFPVQPDWYRKCFILAGVQYWCCPYYFSGALPSQPCQSMNLGHPQYSSEATEGVKNKHRGPVLLFFI